MPYEPLLGPSEVAEIQNVARGQFNTPVIVFRPTQITVSSPSYNPSYDYGDSALTDPVYAFTDGDPAAAVTQPDGVLDDNGYFSVWFLSRLQPDVGTPEMQLSTSNIHIVRAPVGSDVRVEDILRVIASTEEYVVVDTNADDSWPEMMKMLVRNRE